MLWDFWIQTDQNLEHNTFDITVGFFLKKAGFTYRCAGPNDGRVVQKYLEKTVKYQDLAMEMQRLWNKPGNHLPACWKEKESKGGRFLMLPDSFPQGNSMEKPEGS